MSCVVAEQFLPQRDKRSTKTVLYSGKATLDSDEKSASSVRKTGERQRQRDRERERDRDRDTHTHRRFDVLRSSAVNPSRQGGVYILTVYYAQRWVRERGEGEGEREGERETFDAFTFYCPQL